MADEKERDHEYDGFKRFPARLVEQFKDKLQTLRKAHREWIDRDKDEYDAEYGPYYNPTIDDRRTERHDALAAAMVNFREAELIEVPTGPLRRELMDENDRRYLEDVESRKDQIPPLPEARRQYEDTLSRFSLEELEKSPIFKIASFRDIYLEDHARFAREREALVRHNEKERNKSRLSDSSDRLFDMEATIDAVHNNKLAFEKWVSEGNVRQAQIIEDYGDSIQTVYLDQLRECSEKELHSLKLSDLEAHGLTLPRKKRIELVLEDKRRLELAREKERDR